MSWADEAVRRAEPALLALSDPERASAMAAYMRGVAPFLGVATPPRRAALRAAWKGLPAPTSYELGEAARSLMAMPAREFHYAAADLINRHRRVLDERFAREDLTGLLTTTPWWDTVDGFVNVAVSPLCRQFPLDDVVDTWSESGDRWLVRSAIGHQRGWRSDTDVVRVLSLCDRHWSAKEFFIAKAIGWALRDLTAIDASAVSTFLEMHSARNAVAEREARRGLVRSALRSTE